MSWDDIFAVMQAMEKPHVKILMPGLTLYMPAGQLHVSFSPETSIMHRFATANLHDSELNRVETTFLWMRSQINRLMRLGIHEPRLLFELMEAQLMNWTRATDVERTSKNELIQDVIEESRYRADNLRPELYKSYDDASSPLWEGASSSSSKRKEPPE
ncbi:hypothetical protein NDA16_000464 [Ustilago loliicola]|nr:hypothetical protein NDA16_000464 [Ustilago loliicola]